MGIEQTTTLTNSITTVYKSRYLDGARMNRLYDQLAVPYTELGADGKTMDEMFRSSTIYIPFLSDMVPGVTAISQTADVTPQTLTDTTASVTTTSRGEALQWSQELQLKVYTPYTAAAYERVGANAMESIELLAQAAACQGTWVERAAARASLDAGTSGNRASDAMFRKLHAKMLTLKVPGFIDANGDANTWSCIMHPYPFHDIGESGNVDSIGLYQQAGIHLNFELGKIGPFRLVVSPWAKVFGGAGADNATNVADTLSTDATALATTYVTTGNNASNVAVGELWTIGTEETGNTYYATNERVKNVSASTYTITFIGEGPNGGFRFPHAAGAAVRNADSVYTMVFGGPASLVKVYAVDVGEFGDTVGPKKTGILDQFNTLGWKYWGNYARVAENRLLRAEVSTSYEA